MMGAITGIVLYFIVLWKLVDWYDEAYRKEWYWRFREKKKRFQQRIKRQKPKKEILGYQNY